MGSGGGNRGHSNRCRNRGHDRSKGVSKGGRRSRSSILMTAERARAIQSHADRTGRNQGFKGRTMSATDRHENDGDFDEDD